MLKSKKPKPEPAELNTVEPCFGDGREEQLDVASLIAEAWGYIYGQQSNKRKG